MVVYKVHLMLSLMLLDCVAQMTLRACST